MDYTPVFEFLPGSAQLRLQASPEAARVARENGRQAERPLALPSAQRAEAEAWWQVLALGGDLTDRRHILSRTKVLFAQYRGQTFRWLLTHDLGHTVALLAGHEAEREGGAGSSSPLMCNKDSLLEYARLFPAVAAAIADKKKTGADTESGQLAAFRASGPTSDITPAASAAPATSSPSSTTHSTHQSPSSRPSPSSRVVFAAPSTPFLRRPEDGFTACSAPPAVHREEETGQGPVKYASSHLLRSHCGLRPRQQLVSYSCEGEAQPVVLQCYLTIKLFLIVAPGSSEDEDEQLMMQTDVSGESVFRPAVYEGSTSADFNFNAGQRSFCSHLSPFKQEMQLKVL